MRGIRARAGGETKKRGRRIASIGLALGLAVGIVTTASGTARAEDPPAPAPATVPGCANRTVKSDLAVPPAQQSSKWMVYDCSFSDDFDGATYDASKWTAQRTAMTGYKSGDDACFVDDSDNIRTNNGALELTARQEEAPFACPGLANPTTSYTSGSLTTAGKFTQTYGRFEIRAKMPTTTVAGTQFTFWLYPEDRNHYGAQWPSSGELDIEEWFSQFPNNDIPFMHYKGQNAQSTNNHCTVTNMADWHTYAVEWSPDAINFLYDGTVCLRNTTWAPTNGISQPAPFDQPFNINLTTALGVVTNQFNPSTTPLPATATVDYVYGWVGHIEDKPALQLSRILLASIRPTSLANLLRTQIPRCVVCPPSTGESAAASSDQ